MSRCRPIALGCVCVAASSGFLALSRAVARRRTVAQDRALRDTLQEGRGAAGEAASEALGPLGKEWLHVPAAAALGAYLWTRGAGSRAVVPALASVTAEIVSRVLDHTPPHRHPPPGHPSRHKPSFPSGHANETTAVALTTAYVLAREDEVAAVPAFAAAAGLSCASAAGRLYLDRHWASDAVGGLLLGVAVASGCAAIYEAMPGPGTGTQRATRGSRRARIGEGGPGGAS
jgi:membrane-associated phospholipid phosphatase